MVKTRFRALRPLPATRAEAKEEIGRIFGELSSYDFTSFYHHMRFFVTISFSGQLFI
jgi:hypothetical protein